MNQENEKKEYTKPEMEVLAYQHQGNLLQQGSCEEGSACDTGIN